MKIKIIGIFTIIKNWMYKVNMSIYLLHFLFVDLGYGGKWRVGVYKFMEDTLWSSLESNVGSP